MRKALFVIAMILAGQGLLAQDNYSPSKENLEARKWFEDAKFGLFVHWGIYSLLGDGEWVMQNQNIPITAYEKLPSFFNPIDYDPDEWVSMAKDAGMKYITITSRHHDGFSMFDTQATDYNIASTPYGKDVLKALAEACRKEGVKLFFYYSLLDWHHDDYFPRGRTGTNIPGRSTSGDWEKYIAFMKVQLTELLTNYGEIAGIWFDGHWDQKEWDGKKFGKLQVNWHYDELYKLIHELQPQCLIGNNHHLAPIPGEDFQMFERDLPGHNTTGWGTAASDVDNLPKEVCETINGSWGFNLQDQKHKSAKELVQYVIRSAGYGSNLLLNVGPMPNGGIQKEHKEALKKVGEWMREYGETIYGTFQGPIAPTAQWASTQKGNKVYLHLMDESKKIFFIENFDEKIDKMQFYNTKEEVPYTINNYGLLLEVPEGNSHEIATVIEITLQ